RKAIVPLQITFCSKKRRPVLGVTTGFLGDIREPSNVLCGQPTRIADGIMTKDDVPLFFSQKGLKSFRFDDNIGALKDFRFLALSDDSPRCNGHKEDRGNS